MPRGTMIMKTRKLHATNCFALNIKYALLLFCFLLQFACSKTPTNSPDPIIKSWNYIDGKGLGKISVVEFTSQEVLYAGTGTSLCRSFDRGLQWQYLEFNYVQAFAENSHGHLFATMNHGVYRSIDLGNTWEIVLDDTSGSSYRGLAINSKGHIFAVRGSIEGKSVYRSKDNGQTWELKTTGITNNYLRCIAIDSNDFLYIGSMDGMFRSKNNGDTWEQINRGLEMPLEPPPPYSNVIVVFSILIDEEGYIYAGTHHDSGIYYSQDQGDNWSSLGLYDNAFFSLDLNSSGNIFAATDSGVFRSNDKGGSWFNIGLKEHFVLDIAIDSDDYIYAAVDGTVYRSNEDKIFPK
jgi:photosystem II stability/assembly factor-like uncharacterized protein